MASVTEQSISWPRAAGSLLQPIELGEDADRAEQSADRVRNRIAEMQRRAALLAAHPREAAHRLEHPGKAGRAAIGPGLAEPGDAKDGQPRVDALQPARA